MFDKDIDDTKSAIGDLELINIILLSVFTSQPGSVTFNLTLYFHLFLNKNENNFPHLLYITLSLFISVISHEKVKFLSLDDDLAEKVKLSHKNQSSCEEFIVAIGLWIETTNFFSTTFNSFVFNLKVTV